MAYDFRLANTSDPTISNWQTVDSLLSRLGKPADPQWTYQPYTSYQDLLDGTRRGMGFPMATWHWQFLTDVQREALRALCPGLSAQVYIKTLTNETSSGVRTYGTFSAVMFWPPASEDKQAGNVLGFTLEFHHLVAGGV